MPIHFNDKIYTLIHDQKFLNWVIEPNEDLDNYWNTYLLQNPGINAEIKEARKIITSLVNKEDDLSEESVEQLWNRIDRTIAVPETKTIKFNRWVAAASIAITIGIAGMLTYLWQGTPLPVDYSSITRLEPLRNDVTLFLSDSTKEIFSTNEVKITYEKNGMIKTGSGKVLGSEVTKNTKIEEQLNQLVVPFGKHSNIILSDGTKLWLNSGSRAIYPVKFGKNSREIFIEGEAFLEVAHNANQPFFVKTDKVTVKVLGTAFNISAYPDDHLSSVVLVEGSVEASVGKEEVIIKPNQVFSVEKKSGEFCLKHTNVLEYTSWKDGWLLCNKEKLGSINAKLSRYYNIKIEISDTQINDLTLSGKLDLKNDYNDVFKSIALTAPIKYEYINDKTVKLTLK